jgi:putative iron-dependent peroxidase
VAKLTRAAIFLVVTINSGPEHEATVRSLCSDLAALQRAVGFRDLEGQLSCVMAFGSEAWDRLFRKPRPKELHPFREIHGRHLAVATPGDIPILSDTPIMDLEIGRGQNREPPRFRLYFFSSSQLPDC